MQHIPTNNIKIASALITLGFKTRQPDPITNVKTNPEEKPQYVFWFDDDPVKVREIIGAAYAFLQEWKYTLPENHPLYYILAAHFNREILLKWMNQTEPFIRIEKGDQCLLMPENASEDLKKKMRAHL